MRTDAHNGSWGVLLAASAIVGAVATVAGVVAARSGAVKAAPYCDGWGGRLMTTCSGVANANVPDARRAQGHKPVVRLDARRSRGRTGVADVDAHMHRRPNLQDSLGADAPAGAMQADRARVLSQGSGAGRASGRRAVKRRRCE